MTKHETYSDTNHNSALGTIPETWKKKLRNLEICGGFGDCPGNNTTVFG